MTTQNETNLARAPWGQHLVLDFNGCPKELLADKENILNWSKELVKAIDMVAYGEPIIEHFATHSHEAAGYTLLQMIETSNIAAHFAENIGQVYIDVFSCKAFAAWACASCASCGGAGMMISDSRTRMLEFRQ